MMQVGPTDVVFHFNKAHLSNTEIPPWVLKIKGETHYVYHVDFENVSFSTKESPQNLHTKGSLKFKKCYCKIDELGNAEIYQE